METEKEEKKRQEENLAKLLSVVMQTKAEEGTLGQSLLKVLEKHTNHNHKLEITKYIILVIIILGIVGLQMNDHYTAEVGTILGIVIGHLFTKKSE